MRTKCPACGADVSPNARGCSSCRAPLEPAGAGATTARARPKKSEPRRPWEQDEVYDGVDLPLSDDEFDYEEFIEEEFGQLERGREKHLRAPKVNGLAWYWWVVALLLVVGMVAMLVTTVWW